MSFSAVINDSEVLKIVQSLLTCSLSIMKWKSFNGKFDSLKFSFFIQVLLIFSLRIEIVLKLFINLAKLDSRLKVTIENTHWVGQHLPASVTGVHPNSS